MFEQLYAASANIIIKEQHGFMRGRSTATNLSIFANFLSCKLEMGSQVGTVYTDFSKAFDKVNHELLLIKLKLLGVRYNLIHWFSSYLIGRAHMVRVNGSYLSEFFADSINEIKLSNFRLFADDLKKFRVNYCLYDCELYYVLRFCL